VGLFLFQRVDTFMVTFRDLAEERYYNSYFFEESLKQVYFSFTGFELNVNCICAVG